MTDNTPQLIELLRRIPATHPEKALQERMVTYLNRLPGYVREFHCGSGLRIDFALGRIGIECKVGGTENEVLRQLYDYANSECFDDIILVTTTPLGLIPSYPKITNHNGRTIRLFTVQLWHTPTASPSTNPPTHGGFRARRTSGSK